MIQIQSPEIRIDIRPMSISGGTRIFLGGALRGQNAFLRGQKS